MTFPRESGPNRLALPLASFFNDLAWELPILLLPLFIVNVLGAGPLAVGIIEGVAEATSTAAKVVSGLLADRTGKRKRLTAAGYIVANLSRPLLLIVSAWPQAVAVRFGEKVGKGLRTSARDALLADSLTEGQMGAGFGFLRAMDSFGAFGSLFLGLAVIYLIQGNAAKLQEHTFRTLVALASIPGFIAVGIILVFVKEVRAKKRMGLDLNAREGLPRSFLVFTGISALFTLGNSSDAFVILRAQNLGASAFGAVALMTGFNLIYALVSRPLGGLSDRLGKRRLIVAGWLLYAVVYLGIASVSGLWGLGALLVPYAIYYGLTEGIGRALVADQVPAGSRGAAYGLYHGALGGSALLASILAGFLYGRSPALPFYLGAALAGAAALLLIVLVREPRPKLETAAA